MKLHRTCTAVVVCYLVLAQNRCLLNPLPVSLQPHSTNKPLLRLYLPAVMDTPHLSDTGESETDDYVYIPSIWEDADLSAVYKTATKQLNYDDDFVPFWHKPEGFREAYQNW